MKLLKLVFINIRQGFKSSPLIYLVFIVGSVLSGIAFIYLYGNVMPYMKGDYSTYFSYRTCTAVMDGSEPIREDSFKRLSEYVENWDICDIVIMSDQTGLLTCDKNSVQIPLGASLSNGVETHTYKMSGKQKFGQKEIAEKKKAAIIPYLYWPTGVTADNLSYNGEDFEIAGVYSGSAGFTTVYIAF